MKQIAIGFGTVIVVFALVQLLIAVLPFLLGVIGVVLIWFAIARIVKTCFDIVNHDIWRM